MSLPAGDGLAVVYVLADEWLSRQILLSAVGMKEHQGLDAILDRIVATRRKRDPQARAEQVAAFVAAMGGEMVSG